MKHSTTRRGSGSTGGHDYATKMEVSTDSTKRKDPFSPVKTQPNPKKKDLVSEESVSAILDAIKQLSNQTSMLANKVESLSSQIQQNSVMLANMVKAVEFNAAEIKDCKTLLQVTEKVAATNKKDTAELKERVLELERYKRRWNLRIRGIKEKEGENLRDTVTSLLVKISPSWSPSINYIVDSVHRLGRREENRTRHVIIQFTQRIHRDALWRLTKDSPICRDLGIGFMEDLCKADRDTRAAAWPKIQQARAAGKRAYYRGGDAYIDGQRIT